MRAYENWQQGLWWAVIASLAAPSAVLVPMGMSRAGAETASREADTEAVDEVTFSGMVVGPDGAAQPNVLVAAYYRAAGDSLLSKRAVGIVRTDAAGRFTYAMPADRREPPGQVDIYVSKEGLALGWARWALDGDAEATMQLEEPSTLAGKVVDEAGRGVEEADVRALLNVPWSFRGRQLRAQIFGVLPFNGLAARTDAAGRFVLGNIPAGARAELLVAAPGRGTLVTGGPLEAFQDLQFRAGQEDIRIVLPREAIVRGVVLDDDDGTPVEGQKLEVWLRGPGASFLRTTCVSAEGGLFEVAGLCPGVHGIGLVTPAGELPEWVAAPVYVKTRAGETTGGVTIGLSRGGTLDVVITDVISSQPIEGARISVDSRRNQDLTAQSDADGRRCFRVLPGRWRVAVSADSYKQPGGQQVEVIEGATSDLALWLTPLPDVKGVVLDPAGEPVADASVRIGAHGPLAQTDTAGRFQVGAGSGSYDEDHVFSLLVLHRGRGLARAIELSDGPQTTDITLLPGRTIVGRVVDADGEPIPGAQVEVMWHMRSGYAAWGEPLTTSPEGQYRLSQLPLLPQGQSFCLWATADGYGRDEKEVFLEEAQGEHVEAEALVLQRANLSVSGMVVDEAGRPIAGATVGASGNGQPHRTARTDAAGRFRIDNLCTGRVRIRVAEPDSPLPQEAEVEAGAADVRLVHRLPGYAPVPILDTNRLP